MKSSHTHSPLNDEAKGTSKKKIMKYHSTLSDSSNEPGFEFASPLFFFFFFKNNSKAKHRHTHNFFKRKISFLLRWVSVKTKNGTELFSALGVLLLWYMHANIQHKKKEQKKIGYGFRRIRQPSFACFSFLVHFLRPSSAGNWDAPLQACPVISLLSVRDQSVYTV